MTITLHAWMIVPCALTALAFAASAKSAFSESFSLRDDYIAIWAVWAVFVAVSLLSIWSAA